LCSDPEGLVWRNVVDFCELVRVAIGESVRDLFERLTLTT
jgi:hypothetical protein